MATSPAPDPILAATAAAGARIAAYRAVAGPGDVLAASDDPAWTAMLAELSAVGGDNLGAARERVRRHVADIGTGFRVAGEAEERPWPLSPVPLLIAADEWRGIAAGVAQRADLLERVTADLYGAAELVADGTLPAALVTGSPGFLRQMKGLTPPGGRWLHLVAFDLGRDAGGRWRVLADHLQAPVGAGYALENRLAVNRTLGGLAGRLGVARHAPFFAAFRDGLAAACRRAEPRIALLTAGRWSASYAEQAHLARYLGFLLVEGGDLAARDDRLYVRTVAGLKRIDGVWGRIDPRLLDPLALDSRSRIGVPGLIDAYAAGEVAIANAPGAGLAEQPAFAAYLPQLAERLLGAPLALASVVMRWCGAGEMPVPEDATIAPAFAGRAPLGLPGGRAACIADLDTDARADLRRAIARRPQDYVVQDPIRLSTMPAVLGDRLEPSPFTLRVFAARDAGGGWVVLPGGFPRLGDGTARGVEGSADVCIYGGEAFAEPTSPLPAAAVAVRRNPGTLPSRVADNLFWLGRYLERGEALLAAIRTLLGHSIDADGGATLPHATVVRLVGLIANAGAAPRPSSLGLGDLVGFARAAMGGGADGAVGALLARCRSIGEGARERLSADTIRLLEAPFPTAAGTLDRAGTLQRRYAALAGLSAEHMARTAAWRFLDLGRRIERATAAVRAAWAFGAAAASLDDLSTLLDLADSQIGYRQRYGGAVMRGPVVDLVLLDPGNPRGLAFQVERMAEHLGALPVLADDGMAEPQQRVGAALAATLAASAAATVDGDWLSDVDRRLGALSDAVAERYFLHGVEPLRAGGLTLA